MMPSRLLLLLALGACLAACATRTQTIVVVDGDATVRAEGASLDIEVLGPASETIRSLTVHPGTDAPRLPFTLALEPAGGDASRRFTVAVTARRSDGTALTSARASSGYVAGRALELRVFLDVRCASLACSGEQTCRAGVCAPTFVDPSTLPGYPAEAPDAASGGDGAIDAGHDGGGADGGSDAGGDGGSDAAIDGGSDAGADGGSDAAIDGGSDAGRDGGHDAGTDAGTMVTGPLLVAGAAGATVHARAFGTNDTIVCVGGESDRALVIGGTPIPAGSSGLGTEWIACYDVSGAAPTLRFARAIESLGGMRVGALTVEPAGTVIALVYSDSGAARSFDGLTAMGHAYALRLSTTGTITAATALSAETEYVTTAVISGSTLFVSDMDGFGNSGAITRLSLPALSLLTTEYLTNGWHYGIAVSSYGIVVAHDEPTNTAVVYRVNPSAIRPATWTLRGTATPSDARAAVFDATGTDVFVTGAARGDMGWVGDSHVTHGTDPAFDAWLSRLDAGGNVAWITRVAASTGDDLPTVAALLGGEVVITGSSPALDAPPGLGTLPSDGGSLEAWVVAADPSTGSPTRWERVASTSYVIINGAGVAGGALYVVGDMQGTTRAVSSSAFGPSGTTATGVQDAFLVRLPLP